MTHDLRLQPHTHTSKVTAGGFPIGAALHLLRLKPVCVCVCVCARVCACVCTGL